MTFGWRHFELQSGAEGLALTPLTARVNKAVKFDGATAHRYWNYLLSLILMSDKNPEGFIGQFRPGKRGPVRGRGA